MGDVFAQQEFLGRSWSSRPPEDRTRPNLKIQDGCNNRCTFCIIPFVRGKQPQRPARSDHGSGSRLEPRYREVVLSGVNLGALGAGAGHAHAAG